MEDTQTPTADNAIIDNMFGEKTPEPSPEEVKQRVSEMLDGVQYERNLFRTCFDVIPVERLAELGQINADNTAKIQDLEDEMARVAKSFKARIQSLESDIRERSRTIRLGTEECEVECRELFDRTFGRAYVERIDTGEIIENRPLSEREQQLYMQLADDEVEEETAESGDATPPLELSESEHDKPPTRAQARKAA